MKRKSLYMLLITMLVGCIFFVSCKKNDTKTVTNVEQIAEGLKITYSDGTTTIVEVKGQVGPAGAQGPAGEQGPTGEQGPAGEAAPGIEFRYYRAQLWWKYENTNTWYPLVSSETLDAEDLSLSDGDFTMSIYAEEYDVVFDITTYVKVNGKWANGEVAGNTLTIPVGEGENAQYFDITKDGEEYKIVTYKEEGVDETPVEYVENEKLDAFIGTYTLKSGEEEVVVSINEYGTPNLKVNEQTVYMSGYVRGTEFVAKANATGDETSFVLAVPAMGPEFVTNLKDAEGVYAEKSDWEVIKWVDVAEIIGIYTMNKDDAPLFDFQLKANNSLQLYDEKYPQYQYNIDTASFVVNEVTYEVKKDAEGNVVATASDGSNVTVTVWDNLAPKLASFSTVEGENAPIAWTINEYGGVNKDGSYYSSAVQQKNTITLKPWSGNEYFTVTQNADGTFTAARVVVEGENTTEYQLNVITEAKIEDFCGKYEIVWEQNGNERAQTFEIGLNPYQEGQYAFIIGGNPNSFKFDAVERTATYTNNRGGYGFMVTSNVDGSKEVVYFFVDDAGQPDESTFITCTVKFTKAE